MCVTQQSKHPKAKASFTDHGRVQHLFCSKRQHQTSKGTIPFTNSHMEYERGCRDV